MSKTKVCHIVTLLELGGAQQNTLFTVRELDRARYDVSLICGRGAILDEEARKIPDLKLHFVDTLVRPVRPWKDLACVFELAAILKREKPDIVHTHSSKAGIVGRLAARLANVPVVIHSIHGFGFNPYQKFFVRWLFVALEKWMAQLSDCLIAVSSRNIEEGLQLGIGRREMYTLIRSGVDIAKIRAMGGATEREKVREALGIPPDHRMVLKIAPFKVQKDPLAFVELAARVLKSQPKTAFVIAGDGELRPRMEARIQELGIADRFHMLGWRRDVPQILAACDLFVLTSLWEGLPRSGVEALILGKPVVAFAVDGIPEIVQDGENGYVLRPGDLAGMAERVSQLLGSPELARRLSERAAASIDGTFDIHGMVRSQEALYDRLLRKTG